LAGEKKTEEQLLDDLTSAADSVCTGVNLADTDEEIKMTVDVDELRELKRAFDEWVRS
jgi:hypothetical protein